MYSLQDLQPNIGLAADIRPLDRPLFQSIELARKGLDRIVMKSGVEMPSLRQTIMAYHYYPQYIETWNAHKEFTDAQLREYQKTYMSLPAETDIRFKAIFSGTKIGLTTNPEKMSAAQLSQIKASIRPAPAPVAAAPVAAVPSPIIDTINKPIYWPVTNYEPKRTMITWHSGININQPAPAPAPAPAPLMGYYFLIDGLNKVKFTLPKTPEGDFQRKTIYNRAGIYPVDVLTFNAYVNGTTYTPPVAAAPVAAAPVAVAPVAAAPVAAAPVAAAPVAAAPVAAAPVAAATMIDAGAVDRARGLEPAAYLKYWPYAAAAVGVLLLMGGGDKK